MTKGKNQIENLYALNLKDAEIYILDAPSGRKGYFCIGCKREMQAVISKKQSRKSYFRHDPKDVQGKGKCTYSDETYRHALSKSILQEIKKIKVPPVYKYPPKGVPGFANLISDSKYIYANSVGIEYCFYENEDGSISFGKSYEPQSKYLLIKPDVTFFDEGQKPILFIELVATHKISEEKLIKIKRLGINTIQVIIPKDSPEAISRAFTETTNTKWVYNYEQESAKYIPVPVSTSTGIQPIDEIQRNLFEETIKCRSSQIRNLIRTINKCLESESYRGIEQNIRSEISRTEKNTESNRIKWNSIQSRRRTEIQDSHSDEISRIEGRREDIERSHYDKISGVNSEIERLRNEEERFQRRCRNLEDRYQRKKSELNTEISRIRRPTGFADRPGETIGQAITRERFVIESINREQADLDEKLRNFGSAEDQLRIRFGKVKKETIESFKKDRSDKIEQISRIQSNIESLPDKFANLEESMDEEFRNAEQSVKLEYDQIYRSVIGEIEIGESGKHGTISGNIKNFFQAISLLGDINNKYNDRKRYQEALDSIRSGAYKNWNK